MTKVRFVTLDSTSFVSSLHPSIPLAGGHCSFGEQGRFKSPPPPPQFNLADRSYGNELVGQRKGCVMRGMDGWEGGVGVPLFTSGTPRPSCPPCPQPLLLLSLSY